MYWDIDTLSESNKTLTHQVGPSEKRIVFQLFMNFRVIFGHLIITKRS